PRPGRRGGGLAGVGGSSKAERETPAGGGVSHTSMSVRGSGPGALRAEPAPLAINATDPGQPAQRPRQVPIPVAEELHGRREQDAPDDRRVDQDGGREPHAHLLEVDEG